MCKGHHLTVIMLLAIQQDVLTCTVVKTPQSMPDICSIDDRCPNADVKSMTELCCDSRPGLVYHCQEQTVSETREQHAVHACLPSVTCRAGEYAKLYTESNGKYAWINCHPCERGYYETKSKESYKFKYDFCSQEKIQCDEALGKALCFHGGAEKDDKCRCLNEKGYAPLPNTEECRCFGMHMACECEEKECPRGQKLNSKYKCVPPDVKDRDL